MIDTDLSNVEYGDRVWLQLGRTDIPAEAVVEGVTAARITVRCNTYSEVFFRKTGLVVGGKTGYKSSYTAIYPRTERNNAEVAERINERNVVRLASSIADMARVAIKDIRDVNRLRFLADYLGLSLPDELRSIIDKL